jgi:YD repeat-containing protein
VFDWTPAFGQAGTYAGVRLIASDGQMSRFAAFTITAHHVDRPPQMVPLLPQFGLEGRDMNFSVTAGDPQASALSYSAQGLPAGATLNPATGFVDWTPNFGQAGDYTITFTATNAPGLTDSTQVHVHIDHVSRPPVLAATDHSVRLGNELRFTIPATDLDAGTTLTYGGLHLPQGATVDPATGVFDWRPGPGQLGDFVVGLTASDGQAASSQMIVIHVAINPAPPSVTVELTPSFPAKPGDTVLVHVIAHGLAPITSLTATLGGQPLTLDAQGRAHVTAGTPGKMDVVATATDADGLVTTVNSTLKVRDPNDTTAPVVALDANGGNSLLQNGTVSGTVSDSNLDTWTLAIQPLGGSTFQTVATGDQPVSDGTLAVLDVAAMPNGFYVLKLTAQNISGQMAQTEAVVEVRTAQKRDYTRTETDLSVTLDGVPVTISREYDSTWLNQQGKFGYGWRLTDREINLRTDTPLTGYESEGIYNPYHTGTKLYLTTPDGQDIGFTFNPVATVTPGVTYYAPAWDVMPGSPTGWTLTTPGLKLMKAGNLFFDLATARPYNPLSPFFKGQDFVLTGPDGTQYGIDASLGIISITTPSGGVVHVGDSGIVGADGTTIQFFSDSAGRIDRMVAPDGTTTVYTYDAQGNLTAARQLSNGATDRYGYDPNTPHALTTAVNASGTGTAISYSLTALPATATVLANVGPAAQFTGQTYSGTLAAGASDNYAFSVRSSEINSTASGEVLLRVAVTDNGAGLQPAVPQIAGLMPLSTFVAADHAEALFAVSQEGLYRVSVTGANGSTGAYHLNLFVAGDLNGDGKVDGVDSQIMAAAQGTHAGDPGYLFAADLNGDGVIDFNDSLIRVLPASVQEVSLPPRRSA